MLLFAQMAERGRALSLFNIDYRFSVDGALAVLSDVVVRHSLLQSDYNEVLLVDIMASQL